MKKIDELFSKKKLLYKEYLSLQLVNAQEYYKLIKILSEHPDYKDKLKPYKLKEVIPQPLFERKEKTKPLSKQELSTKQINKLCDFLKPLSKKYTKKDIYETLGSEGFDQNIIESVLKKLETQGFIFAKTTLSKPHQKELSTSLNQFITGKDSQYFRNIKTSESFSLEQKEKGLFSDNIKRKDFAIIDIEEDITDIDPTKAIHTKKQKKPSFFKRIFSFKKKKKTKDVNVDDVDQILKNIEKELKDREL